MKNTAIVNLDKSDITVLEHQCLIAGINTLGYGQFGYFVAGNKLTLTDQKRDRHVEVTKVQASLGDTFMFIFDVIENLTKQDYGVADNVQDLIVKLSISFAKDGLEKALKEYVKTLGL